MSPPIQLPDLFSGPDLPSGPAGGTLTEAELLEFLAGRVSELLVHQHGRLMSLCYTMDIDEAAVAAAFHPAAAEPANRGLARLILDRHKRRLQTRREVRTPPLEGEFGW
ncbi:MAG: hypothetical protein WBA17_15265 [Saprospiraceae bacterium]